MVAGSSPIVLLEIFSLSFDLSIYLQLWNESQKIKMYNHESNIKNIKNQFLFVQFKSILVYHYTSLSVHLLVILKRTPYNAKALLPKGRTILSHLTVISRAFPTLQFGTQRCFAVNR